MFFFFQQPMDYTTSTAGLNKWIKNFPQPQVNVLQKSLRLSWGMIKATMYSKIMLWLFHHSYVSPHCSYLLGLSPFFCCLKCGHLNMDLFYGFEHAPRLNIFGTL